MSDATLTTKRSKPYTVIFGLPIGVPQILAGLLLLGFVAECLWIAVRTLLRPNEIAQIEQGQLWLAHRGEEAGVHSILVPLLATAGEIASQPNVAAAPEGINFR